MRIYNSLLNKKTLTLLLVSFLSFISWNYLGLIFVLCLVLFFYYADLIKNKNIYIKTVYFYIYYIVLNLSITFWLNRISLDKLIYIILFSSMVMTISTIPYVLTNNRIVHIFSWVFFEIICTKWDVAWPWLIYGNVMGNQWYLVKWYSITGVYGGSLWLFILSYFIYINIKKKAIRNIYIILIILALPIFSIISYFIKKDYNNYLQVLHYAPFYKYGNYEKTKSIAKYIIKSNDKFDLITMPELFYSDINISDLETEKYRSIYKLIFNNNPNLKIVIGAEIRNFKNRFNGTIVLTKDTTLFKSKKKYVPITEFTTPILRPIFGESYYNKNSIDDTELIKKETNTTPFVCYEALFSDFIARNTYNSKYIIISTSETFMNQSKFGQKQYLNIIRLRAIENNKFLLKCSSDGISCVINPDGKVIEYLNTEELMNVKIHIVDENSFYNKLINNISNQ